MPDKNLKNTYDDDDIPKVDLPQTDSKSSTKSVNNVEPLPESFRPRKDGPGGD